MKVTATAKGYFGSLREVGEEFEVPDGTSASWFSAVAEPEAEAQSKPARGRKARAAEPEAGAEDDVADAI